MKRGWLIVLLVASIIIVCGCALFSGLYGLGLFLNYAEDHESNGIIGATAPTATPVVNRPLPVKVPSKVLTDSNDTLTSLKEIELPPSDLRELAQRLKGEKDKNIT